MHRPTKALTGRATLLVGALLIAWTIAELLVPTILPEACRSGTPLWHPRADVGWSLIPGAVASVPTCGPERRELARHRIEVNALGQRDRPREWARTPGHQRVLVLGDSFVEATQVDLEDTFPARLEGATGIEMLNAGVSGYSTDNELRFFRVGGAPYRPDLVLLVLHTGNDVLENGPRLFLQNPHGLLPKPWLRSTDSSVELAACLAAHRATAAFADALPLFVWRHSAATRLLLTQGVATGIGVPCRPWTGPPLVDGVPELLGVFGEPPTDAWREGWTVTEELLGTLRAEVRATGAAFAVLIAPSIFEVTSSATAHRAISPAASTPTSRTRRASPRRRRRSPRCSRIAGACVRTSRTSRSAASARSGARCAT